MRILYLIILLMVSVAEAATINVTGTKTSEIQTSVNKAQQLLSEGQKFVEVVIKEGEYFGDESVVIREFNYPESHLTIRGEGKVRIDGSNLARPFAVIDSSNITIDNLCIEGAGNPGPNEFRGFVGAICIMHDSSNITVQNCKLSDVKNNGIAILWKKENYKDDTLQWIEEYLLKDRHIVIRNNVISNFSINGNKWESAGITNNYSDVLISNNTITNDHEVESFGVLIRGRNNIIENNVIKVSNVRDSGAIYCNSQHGFYLSGSNIIRGNEIETKSVGIYLDYMSSFNEVYDNIIKSNYDGEEVSDFDRGVFIFGGRKNKFKKNEIIGFNIGYFLIAMWGDTQYRAMKELHQFLEEHGEKYSDKLSYIDFDTNDIADEDDMPIDNESKRTKFKDVNRRVAFFVPGGGYSEEQRSDNGKFMRKNNEFR